MQLYFMFSNSEMEAKEYCLQTNKNVSVSNSFPEMIVVVSLYQIQQYVSLFYVLLFVWLIFIKKINKPA